MPELKPGARWRDAAGTAEVIVTRGGQGTITCGGVPMVAAEGAKPPNAAAPEDSNPARVVLGKRYRTEHDTVEVLCVRQGSGLLQLDGEPLNLVTQAKPLPASD